MPLEMRWKASLSATCLHAAACRRAGLAAADEQLEQAVAGPADALCGELAAAGWPVEEALGQLVALSGDFENNRELASRCAARLRLPASESEAGRIAGAVADLEAAVMRHNPGLVDELLVRGRPLREQWEARGPGLLHETARLTEESVVPEAAEVVLVAPYVGGHGVAHAMCNRIVFEAMLFNPSPELPEIVRLAWLACQLNVDLPRYADVLRGRRAVRAFALATLPAVLAAAASVEATAGALPIDAALEAWRLRDDLPVDVGERLETWWQTWLDGPSNWTAAVAALERMARG